MLNRLRASVALQSLVVFLLGLLWFSFFISWNVFPDPDAFYHAKISLLLWHFGPVISFPWLDLTSLGTYFADHHFLFHVIEAPFVAWLGTTLGARISAIILASAFMSAAHFSFQALRLRPVWVWTLLLAISPPILLRLLLAKASPLALLLFVVGITVAWTRKRWALFFIAVLFALSHGGWVFLVGTVWLMLLGDMLCRCVVESKPVFIALRETLWREGLIVLAGVGVGTMLHPNFPANISFLWVQIVKIGLGTPYAHVILGNEWLPSKLGHLIAVLFLWVTAGFLALGGMVLVPSRLKDIFIMRQAIAFALPVACILALTLKSQRTVEYLIPMSALWIASLWQFVDIKRYWNIFTSSSSHRRRIGITGLAIILSALAIGRGLIGAHRALRSHHYHDNVYGDVMAPVSVRAREGDRVFHSDWDEFPMLFNIDDRLRYVAGLDPTFLYEASSTLSDAYRDVTWGRTSPTPDEVWNLIHDRLRAQFIFITKEDHEPLLNVIRSDPRYELLAESSEAATFAVK